MIMHFKTRHSVRTLPFLKSPLIILLLAITMSGACTPRAAVSRPALENEGQVFLYLQPLPAEAYGLRFTIVSLSAAGSDGILYPLQMDGEEIRGAEMVEKQLRLSSAVLPPGSYTGFYLSIEKATIETETGETELLVPQDPLWVAHEFILKEKEALAFFLSLQPKEKMIEDIRFSPLFTIETFGRTLTNLLGYITDNSSSIITVIDKNTLYVTDIIAGREGPCGIVLDPLDQRAYVALTGSDAIQIIDIPSGKTINTIMLTHGDEPSEIALTPDQRLLASVNYGSKTLSIIDTGSMYELWRTPVEEGPTSVIIDRRGTKAFVINSFANSMSVVALTGQQLPLSISLEGMPLRGAFNGAGDRLFVITGDSPDVLVIDTATFSVVEKIFVGHGMRSVVVDTTTDLVYVGMDSGDIAVIDPSSLMFIDTILVGGSIERLAIDREESTLFALVPEQKRLLKINMVSKRIIAELILEGSSCDFAINGER